MRCLVLFISPHLSPVFLISNASDISGLEIEGLFRIPGPVVEINAIREKLDKGVWQYTILHEKLSFKGVVQYII